MTFLAVLPRSRRRVASVAAVGVLAALALTSFPSSGVSAIYTTTFAPTADAYVNQAQTSTNFGSAPQLFAGATPTMRSYVKFVVPNLGGSVSRATLSVYATQDSAAGFAVRSAGNGWQEGTVVYSGSPNPSGTITASSGPLTAGTWTTVDVTPLMKSNATITFALTGTGSPAAALASRESSNPPRLDVDINDTAAPAVTVSSPANGATLSTSLPTFGGKAGALFSDSPNVTVKVYAGTTATGTPVQTLGATRGANSNWSVVASAPLVNGQYAFRAEQQDTAGNLGLSGTRTFRINDTASPAVTLTQPVNGSTLLTQMPSFSGTAGGAAGDSSLVTVKVYAGGSATGTPVQTLSATRQANNSYAVGASAPLAPGQYTARAEQQDVAGHTGLSAASTFTIADTTAPVVTLTQPANGSTLSTAVPSFAGVASAAPGDAAGVTVKVYSGSSASGTPVQTLSATRQADSSYAVNASAPLANGTYTAQAEQQDGGGNTGLSATTTFTISDTTAPVVTLTQPADGSTLAAPTPSFAGAAGADAGDAATVTVKVYAGSSASGTPVETVNATRQADSSYAVNASPPLTAGTYTAQAEQQDAGGNMGLSSATTFTIQDATAPVVTLTQPADGATVATATPTFAGFAGNAAGDASGVTVKVYAGSSASGTPVQTLSATRQADSSYSVNASLPLSAGTYTAQTEQQDAMGNTGLSSANTFTVPDAIAPVVTLTQPANGATVSTQLPTYAGSAGAAAGDSATVTVKVYAGVNATGTPVQTLSATRQADSSYSVTGTVALAYGTYTVRAEQQDAGGNTGLSSANTFTIPDTTPPAVTLTQPANGAALTTAVPTFTGVAGSATGDLATVTVRVYTGSSASGTPVRTLTATRQADSSYTVVANPALPNGTYTARAEQNDSGTNTGFSSANTFTISDTTAPTVTLTRPLNNGVTLLRANFTGAASNAPGDAATATVKVYAGTSATGTPVRTLSATQAADSSYSVTLSAAAALTAGTYTARAEQQDAAGNTGLSSENTFKVAKTIVSIGFDDGNAGQWQARDMLLSHGMHATFFLNSPLITNNPFYLTWEQIGQLYADGNEIGGHTMYHSFLLQVDQAEATRQICYDRNNILAHGFPITNFAIPFGEYNNTIKTLIKNCGYNSGRSTDSFEGLCPPSCGETVPPLDLYATRVVGYGPDGLTALQDKVAAAEQNGGSWVQLLFHDICANCGVNGTTAETLQAFLDWLQPRTANDTVTATVQQVVGGTVQPAVPAPPLPPPPGTTNGMRFSGLERDADANGIPDCYRPNSWGNHTGTWTRTADAHAGSWAERVDATGYGDGADVLGTFDDMGYCTPTVVPGRQYRLTTWYKSAGPVRFTVNLRKDDFSSPFPWWTESPSFPASATWRQASWITPPIPAGNNGMLFGLMNTGDGSMTVDDIGIFDATPAP
jgi:peptidoglycan/xylan/chitin deacetylase (PgdA/CDA1 family)